MPTEKPRVTITLAPEQLRRINDFRFDNKMKNQTQAILSLIEAGLAELENETKKTPTATEAAPGNDVTEMFNYLQSSLISAGLLKEGQDITDRQADVLVAVCQIIRATFND